MFLMHADPLWGQVREGWAMEIESLGPVNWNDTKLIGECNMGAKNPRFPGPNPLPLAQVMDLPASKVIAYRNI